MPKISFLLCLAACLFVGTVKAQDEPKTVKLDLLPRDGGGNFGDWVVWRYEDGGPALLLVNQVTSTVIFLPWSSNGWINFRSPTGEWNVLYSKGEPEPQDRKDLPVARLLGKRPSLPLENGKYNFQDWTVKVSNDFIDFHHSAYGDRMVIRRSAGDFTHNGRTVGDKK